MLFLPFFSFAALKNVSMTFMRGKGFFFFFDEIVTFFLLMFLCGHKEHVFFVEETLMMNYE